MPQQLHAFDKSMRSLDVEGRLHVERTNISKAMVCPYLGSEIPDADALGLEPSRIYMLLRDPAELAAAAESFNNLPVLIQHVPVSAAEPRRDLIVGTTGSDVAFDAPYLTCSLAVWDAQAIAGIETKDQAELSSSYRYRADMTPGIYEGTPYDGVMRDIKGNHVALVDIGRAGPDVVVSDQNPFTPRNSQEPTMAKKARKPIPSATLTALLATAGVALKPLLAADAKPEAVQAALTKLAKDAEMAAMDPALDAEPDEDDMEDDPDMPGQRRKKIAKDETPPAKPEGGADKPAQDKAPVVTKAAMDAAIATAAAQATANAIAATNALHTARKAVEPLCGVVALDSAAAVYKFALDHAKVDTTGVHESAFPALVAMAVKGVSEPKPVVAADAALFGKSEMFPELSRFH